MSSVKKTLKTKLPEMISYWQKKEILYQETKKYLKDAIEELNNNELSCVCNSLGSIYLIAKDFEQAKALFEQAGYYAIKEKDSIEYGLSLLNLAELYIERGQAERSFVFCEQFLEDMGDSSLESLLVRDWVHLFVGYDMFEQTESFVEKIIRKNTGNQKHHSISIGQWLQGLSLVVATKDKKQVKEFVKTKDTELREEETYAYMFDAK